MNEKINIIQNDDGTIKLDLNTLSESMKENTKELSQIQSTISSNHLQNQGLLNAI